MNIRLCVMLSKVDRIRGKGSRNVLNYSLSSAASSHWLCELVTVRVGNKLA